jgi:hypothetical protein
VIFNALIGNHDAHAKNFSLLYSGKTPVLAPFYDTLSTAVYPTLTPKMAMKIGSKYKFSEVQARHWEQFAEGVGLPRRRPNGAFWSWQSYCQPRRASSSLTPDTVLPAMPWLSKSTP